MGKEECIEILKHHNNWRKGADIEQTDVNLLTEAIDLAIAILDR